MSNRTVQRLMRETRRGHSIDSGRLRAMGISAALAAHMVKSGWLVWLSQGVYLLTGDRPARYGTIAYLTRRIAGLHVGEKSRSWQGARVDVVVRHWLLFICSICVRPRAQARYDQLPAEKKGYPVLSRGHFIGEIVDDLAILGSQVRMRNAIHMYDLTVVTENFFRDVLNILLGARFENLNKDRSNNPGLDLGDVTKEVAVQVTSSASTQKVNDTLDKITAEQKATYKKFIVLGMNKRQQTYAIDDVLANQYKFSVDDIWDLDTLARKAMDLEIDALQALYNLVRSNTARLKIELEVPDENGKYPTSGYDQWEHRAKPKLGDGSEFRRYFEEAVGEQAPDVADVQQALKKLGTKLFRLPRLTREFLATLYERRESGKSQRFPGDEWGHLLLAKVKREYHGEDLDGELEILKHAGFLSIDASSGDDDWGPPQIGIAIPSELDELRYGFVDFVKTKKLRFKDVIGSNDLSAF